MNRWWILGVVCAAIAGCSSTPPAPIEIGQARGSGQRLEYPTALDSSGYFAFDQWPAACSFLTTDEIRSVLPQAENIVFEPGDTDIRIIPSGREVTALRAKCSVSLDLPGMRAGVLIDEHGAGRPVDRLPKSEQVPRINQTDLGDGCAADPASTEVSCAKDRIVFTISTPFTYQEPVGDGQVRYSAKGTVNSFSSGDFARYQTFLRDSVTVPLARLIVAKI